MSAKKQKKGPEQRQIRNSKASFNYTIGDRFEAGIQLLGTEVKSIREGICKSTNHIAEWKRAKCGY